MIQCAPGTMLGLAARVNRREQRRAVGRFHPIRVRAGKVARLVLAGLALTIGLLGFTTASAQANPFDDMKDNITATVVNLCGPNDVPNQATYTNIDTMAGLNADSPHDGYRSTIKPDFSKDEKGGQGGDSMKRLQRVYGEKGDVIAKPTYERYGFSTLQWHTFGYKCNSPALMMGPLANTALMSMVNVPMMISMAVLNFVVDEALYTAFSDLMQPFIGAMYEIFDPWIFLLVPIGVGITWLGSKGSLQATMKATGWGVLVVSIYLLMGSSTSKVVSWATNTVTEVSGSAACKMNAADNGGRTDNSECDADDPIKAVQQDLWYGIPYQTWHLGQVGEYQAALDEEALDEGEVGWGPALLNGQYVGVDEKGAVDKTGRNVISATQAWNGATYSPEGENTKNELWGGGNQWDKVPYLANVKMMCDDRDNGDDGPEAEDTAMRRWIYSGATGSSKCDSAGAGTAAMVPHIQGDEYNKQILIAMSGMVGVIAVSLTIVVAAVYLGFQKMLFFFLLFLAPMVLLVSSIGDRKRRPFAIRYAEIIGANLLKQIAAVCIVLFVSYAMASLFGSSTFAAVPWIMKPYAALLFFVALAFLAFPLKNMVKGAIQGDTSVVDKQATAPQRAMKVTGEFLGKAAIAGGAIVATGGAAAALGVGAGGLGAVGAGGKAAMAGKAGSMLGQAGRVMGIGSKSGRAMRGAGRLLQAGQGIMDAKDSKRGWLKGNEQAAAEMIEKNPSLYHKVDGDGTLGGLIPGAHQKAMKDAQSTAERGVKNQRAQQSQDDFMKKFFAGWGGPEAPRHQDLPDDDPDMQPKPKSEREPLSSLKHGTRGELGSGSSGSHSGDSEQTPQPPEGNSWGGPSSQGSSPHAGGEEFRPTVDDYQHYAEKARGNLSGPEFSREMEYNVSTVRTGDDVLTNAGFTKQQAIADPTTLLSGDAYDGGRTTAMDPFHAATRALNELRFAGNSGDETAIQRAVERAADAIHQHGVPNQVDGAHSIGDRASRFEAVEIVAAMPRLGDSPTWMERAEAAHTMQAAQVAMPADTPVGIRTEVADYTAQLSRPGVDLGALAEQQADLIESIAWWQQKPTLQDVYEAPPTTASAVSPEDLRSEVSEGLREARLENEASSLDTPSYEKRTPARVEGELVNEVNGSGALVYRPGHKRRSKKRSDFFDHDDNEEE